MKKHISPCAHCGGSWGPVEPEKWTKKMNNKIQNKKMMNRKNKKKKKQKNVIGVLNMATTAKYILYIYIVYIYKKASR